MTLILVHNIRVNLIEVVRNKFLTRVVATSAAIRAGRLVLPLHRPTIRYLLKRQSLIAGGKVDDAAIGETVFGEVVAHDGVVAVRIDAYVGVAGETEVQDVAQHAMRFSKAGDAMHHMIRPVVIEPCPVVDGGVGGFGRWEESEIAHDAMGLLHHETALLRHVGADNGLGRIVACPLMGITRLAHDAPGGFHNMQDLRHVGRFGGTDGSAHRDSLIRTGDEFLWVGIMK